MSERGLTDLIKYIFEKKVIAESLIMSLKAFFYVTKLTIEDQGIAGFNPSSYSEAL